jgi:hypothetical protein
MMALSGVPETGYFTNGRFTFSPPLYSELIAFAGAL